MAFPDAPERLGVLLLAPAGRDAALAAATLAAAGLKAKTCASMGTVCAALQAEPAAVGALVLTEETLASTAESARLAGWLQGQEAWSDLPVVVLANGPQEGSTLTRLLEVLKPSGAVSVLERPLRRATLVTAVCAALRLRARQCTNWACSTIRDTALPRTTLKPVRGSKKPSTPAMQTLHPFSS
jgi:hypothetical protein